MEIPKTVKNVPKRFKLNKKPKNHKFIVSIIHIEFVTSHDNKLNKKIIFLICTFFKRSVFENFKKSQSGPKKIDAKISKNNLNTLYSFMFLHKNGTFLR